MLLEKDAGNVLAKMMVKYLFLSERKGRNLLFIYKLNRSQI